MLLAIDIGNTNIVLGMFRGKGLVYESKMATKTAYSFGKCSSEIYSLPHRDEIRGMIVSSVVPDALTELTKALKRVFKREPLVMGKNIQPPIKNLYKYPEQVGQDRLANGVAAAALYNKGKKNLIVIIDFGSAVTFDVLSKRNEYLGGLIFPGIRLSLENLYQRAALLPKIEIKRPKGLIGKSTKESMRSGILNGYGSLCDGIVKRIAAKFRTTPMVIATGGDARLISTHSVSIDKIDPSLTLKGLRITYDLRMGNPVMRSRKKIIEKN